MTAERAKGGAATTSGLERLVAGDILGGLALYGRAMRGAGPATVPFAQHLMFLEKAGRSAAADALRRLAVRRGLDIAPTCGSPAEVAAEYERLLRAGIANARMVAAYLRALSRLGREDALAAMLDLPRRLRRVQLDLPDPAGEGSLAARLQLFLLDREDQGVYQAAVQSVRGMRKLDHLQRIDDPGLAALWKALRREAELYLDDWAGSDHPVAPLVPHRFRLKAWGLISRGEGYNEAHFHHKGWATGIYYPAAPAGSSGGELRIGPPPGLDGMTAGWPDLTIRPEPGLLVILPSFQTHWTVPLGRPGLRTSIAFDIIPIGGGRAPSG